MDALRGGDGQALVMAALFVGLAAFAVVGLKAAGDHLVDAVRDQRAGEAAVAAAAARVADLLLERAGATPDRATVAAFVRDESVALAARDAAVRIARTHGRADPSAVTIEAFGLEIEVHLTLADRRHIALIEPKP